MEAAINRYRVLAIIVGVMLILVCFVGFPLRVFADNGTPSAFISPTHGILYIVYLAFAYDLWRKTAWPLKQMVIMVSAGLVPFLAFFVEKKIVREAREVAAAQAAQAAEAPAQA
ncbi:DUF3817 domain-containing protein [Spirillospora sp. NPDC047279]|uniref:DUF3817 domain-containing protein n=1 Tax=Spirillospora sp. NPDC047279 TaxID=3155478 RepID=UPI0033D445CD